MPLILEQSSQVLKCLKFWFRCKFLNLLKSLTTVEVKRGQNTTVCGLRHILNQLLKKKKRKKSKTTSLANFLCYLSSRFTLDSTWYSNQGEKDIAKQGFIKACVYMIYFSLDLVIS